jgi:hypothetical protein
MAVSYSKHDCARALLTRGVPAGLRAESTNNFLPADRKGAGDGDAVPSASLH